MLERHRIDTLVVGSYLICPSFGGSDRICPTHGFARTRLGGFGVN